MAGRDGDPAARVRGIDTAIANPARIYDYFLGGKDNFEADRQVGERLLEVYPPARDAIVQNRDFLTRAVRFLTCEAGIRRFLDVGAGLPTQDNVHQIAQKHAPEAQVVYVDNDPVVLTHARALLAGGEGVEVVEGDLRAPEQILNAAAVRRLLEPGEPVGLLMVGVLDFISDAEDPHRAVAAFVEAIPPRSYLVITHGVAEDGYDEILLRARRTFEQATTGFLQRPRAQIIRLLDGLEIVDPGLVEVTRWRPDLPLDSSPGTSAAVARKP